MLAENLKKYRKNKNFTQSKLSKLSGISRRTIVSIEQGKNVRLDTLNVLAKSLDVTIDELVS